MGIRKSIRPVEACMMRCWRGLSVWSKVQMICMWSSWCHCDPIISCFIKIHICLTFLVPACPGCLGKESAEWVSVTYWVKVGLCECLLVQVFEVNTSDQRDGKHLLAQLQEATQSHQLPRTALAPPTESLQHTAQASTGDQMDLLRKLLLWH